jgi:hypothetical protein
MKKFNFLIILLGIIVTSPLFAQSETADKIQINILETVHYSQNTSDLRYKLNFFVNDQYIKGPYDKKFFQERFKNSEKALNLSFDYLELDKKANQTKTKGIVLSTLMGLVGLGSFFYLPEDASKTKKYTIAGVGLASALTTSFIFTQKHHKQKKEGFLFLENALDAYREENPSAYEKPNGNSLDLDEKNKSGETSQDSNSTSMQPINLKDEIKVSIESKDLRNVAFKSININFIDGQYSGSKIQYSPGLDFIYMKNGWFFNGGFGIHIYDTNRFFSKKEYDFDHSPFSVSTSNEAYPITLSLPYYGGITSVIPLKTYMKDGQVMTKMKKYGNTQLMYESKTSLLHSWGIQLGTKLDNSIQSARADFDSNHVLPASSNNLNIPIKNPIFLRKTVNLSAGISKTIFTAYELRPNDKTLDDSYSVVNWARLYLIGKYNINSNYSDMYYKGTVPLTLDNIEETKSGFAIGLEGAYLNKQKGFNFGLEFGSNPHITSGNMKDLYGKMKVGFSLGWF